MRYSKASFCRKIPVILRADENWKRLRSGGRKAVSGCHPPARQTAFTKTYCIYSKRTQRNLQQNNAIFHERYCIYSRVRRIGERQPLRGGMFRLKADFFALLIYLDWLCAYRCAERVTCVMQPLSRRDVPPDGGFFCVE